MIVYSHGGPQQSEPSKWQKVAKSLNTASNKQVNEDTKSISDVVVNLVSRESKLENYGTQLTTRSCDYLSNLNPPVDSAKTQAFRETLTDLTDTAKQIGHLHDQIKGQGTHLLTAPQLDQLDVLENKMMSLKKTLKSNQTTIEDELPLDTTFIFKSHMTFIDPLIDQSLFILADLHMTHVVSKCGVTFSDDQTHGSGIGGKAGVSVNPVLGLNLGVSFSADSSTELKGQTVHKSRRQSVHGSVSALFGLLSAKVDRETSQGTTQRYDSPKAFLQSAIQEDSDIAYKAMRGDVTQAEFNTLTRRLTHNNNETTFNDIAHRLASFSDRASASELLLQSQLNLHPSSPTVDTATTSGVSTTVGGSATVSSAEQAYSSITTAHSARMETSFGTSLLLSSPLPDHLKQQLSGVVTDPSNLSPANFLQELSEVAGHIDQLCTTLSDDTKDPSVHTHSSHILLSFSNDYLSTTAIQNKLTPLLKELPLKEKAAIEIRGLFCRQFQDTLVRASYVIPDFANTVFPSIGDNRLYALEENGIPQINPSIFGNSLKEVPSPRVRFKSHVNKTTTLISTDIKLTERTVTGHYIEGMNGKFLSITIDNVNFNSESESMVDALKRFQPLMTFLSQSAKRADQLKDPTATKLMKACQVEKTNVEKAMAAVKDAGNDFAQYDEQASSSITLEFRESDTTIDSFQLSTANMLTSTVNTAALGAKVNVSPVSVSARGKITRTTETKRPLTDSSAIAPSDTLRRSDIDLAAAPIISDLSKMYAQYELDPKGVRVISTGLLSPDNSIEPGLTPEAFITKVFTLASTHPNASFFLESSDNVELPLSATCKELVAVQKKQDELVKAGFDLNTLTDVFVDHHGADDLFPGYRDKKLQALDAMVNNLMFCIPTKPEYQKLLTILEGSSSFNRTDVKKLDKIIKGYATDPTVPPGLPQQIRQAQAVTFYRTLHPNTDYPTYLKDPPAHIQDQIGAYMTDADGNQDITQTSQMIHRLHMELQHSPESAKTKPFFKAEFAALEEAKGALKPDAIGMWDFAHNLDVHRYGLSDTGSMVHQLMYFQTSPDD